MCLPACGSGLSHGVVGVDPAVPESGIVPCRTEVLGGGLHALTDRVRGHALGGEEPGQARHEGCRHAGPALYVVATRVVGAEYVRPPRGPGAPFPPGARGPPPTPPPPPYARLTAVFSTLESPGPPSERFTTSAPWFILQLMPSTIRESVVNAPAPMTLAMSNPHSKHPPATPLPLSVSAPAMPATWVPCPNSSSATASPSTKSL